MPMRPTPLDAGRIRFLHLIPDDKFIDAAREIFEEALPGAHHYLLVDSRPLRYLRTFEPMRLDTATALNPQFLSTLPKYSAIFVHFLNDAARLILASAPVPTRFIWLAWGADFYHLIHSRDELLLPRTRALMTSSVLRAHKSRDSWMRMTRRIKSLAKPAKFLRLLSAQGQLRRIGRNGPEELKLINRFSAIATPILEDFELIRARHPELRARFLDWNYWAEGFSAVSCPTQPNSNDILLGNSATPENNHLDAMEMLSRCLPAGRKVICPLSYGDRSYGDVVEQCGKALFGDRFVALREYISSASYMQIVEGCSIVVMNHIRQQALGNIIVALCSGARVFLQPQNPINLAMKRMGVDTSSVDSLPDFIGRGEPKISAQRLQRSREVLEEHFGRGSILRRTRQLLDDLDPPSPDNVLA